MISTSQLFRSGLDFSDDLCFMEDPSRTERAISVSSGTHFIPGAQIWERLASRPFFKLLEVSSKCVDKVPTQNYQAIYPLI